MDAIRKATQAAMAAEIGSRLGRKNRSKAWLQREAGISASAWRHYFTAFDRDVPLSAVGAIARALGDIRSGELMILAEDHAHEYAARFMSGVSPEERAEWEALLGAAGKDALGAESQEGLTGS